MRETYELAQEIAEIGHTPSGRNAIALTETEDRTVEHVQEKAQQLFEEHRIDPSQYEIKSDAFGNLFITLFGEDRGHTVMSGSHADSVRDGGDFDGVAGVVSALQLLEKLVQEKRKPLRNYTVAVFRAEESSPTTGVSCLGSKIATRTIAKDDLEKISYRTPDGTQIPLQDYFSERYGEDRWQQVLEELENPPITPENTTHFEEVHIEQSRVVESKGADVGIVSGGIGGARREIVHVPPSEIQTEEIDVTEEKPYVLFRIQIIGQADHTGGTPHSPWPFTYHDPRFGIRKDSLVASADAIYLFLTLKKYPEIHVLRVDVPRATGFTTIPAKQIIEVAVTQDNVSSFLREWEGTERVIRQEDHCKVYIDSESIAQGTTLRCLKNEQLLAAMEIPTKVKEIGESIVARHANIVDTSRILSLGLEPDDSYIGKIRATVTDFQFTPEEGLRFNIDERSVDAEQHAQLARDVGTYVVKKLIEIGINPETARTVISETLSSPIEERSVEMKRRIAQTLEYKPVTMPSMPGQDAGTLSRAGIPTSMTFIRHPGTSHSKEETVTPESLNKAVELSHSYIMQLLNMEEAEEPSSE